jgi:cobalt-zinc-cadmium efflux system protein
MPGEPHHHHRADSYSHSFALGVGLNATFVLVEAVLGIASNSLALVADAGHNLSDVLALVLAWGAATLSRRQATAQRTYGWGRSTVLAALANALLLLVVTGAIGWEAIRRLSEPGPVAEQAMIWVALIGVVVNGSTALLFLPGRKYDLNVRGAFIHMASDAAVSVGVVLAGIAIAATGLLWIDPAVGLVIAVVILLSTWSLLRDSINLALDAVPPGVDVGSIRRYLASLPHVAEVHDLHVWGMSTTETALSVHLVIPDHLTDDALLAQVADELHEAYGIAHATLQLECGDPAHPCPLATVHAV